MKKYALIALAIIEGLVGIIEALEAFNLWG